MTTHSTMNDGIRDDDVLLGRGGRCNGHIGNRKFRTIVASYQQVYLGAVRREKAAIADKVIERIQAKGGRFLRCDETGIWNEVPIAKARQKTGQALREGLDVKNLRLRPEKLARKHESLLKDDEKDSNDENENSSNKRFKLVSGWVPARDHPQAAASPLDKLPAVLVVSLDGDKIIPDNEPQLAIERRIAAMTKEFTMAPAKQVFEV